MRLAGAGARFGRDSEVDSSAVLWLLDDAAFALLRIGGGRYSCARMNCRCRAIASLYVGADCQGDVSSMRSPLALPVPSSYTSAFTPPSSVAPKKVFFSAYRVVLRSGRVSDDMAVILKKMIMTLRRKMNDPLKEMCKLCSGKRERSDGTLCRAQSPCSAWCRQSSRCSPSLTGRLSASLSLGPASTRRSPATSGRCWLADRWQWWPSRAPDGRELAAAT